MRILFLFLCTITNIYCNQSQPLVNQVHQYSYTLTGKAVKIIDGDTFDVRIKDSATIRIRLASIDTPEKTQDYYQVAKDALASYIFGKKVSVTITGTDRYKRLIGIVLVNGKNVNLAMVQDGFAWQYLEYDTSTLYASAEAAARKNKLGLWAIPNPESPWAFKKRKKTERNN